MNILFICQANLGRSQAAMELYNQIKPGESSSAGTAVDEPGQKLSEREGAVNIIEVMKDYDIDMSHNIRKQLNEDMAAKYDKLICMAEPETIPEWLNNHPKTAIWTIQDPKGQDVETTRIIVRQIKERIRTLF
jgi:protein-tyrosine-phosphatase